MAEPRFEKDLERLEAIVTALEEGELSLDDSLKRFEEGIKLARRCEKALNQAEKRIEILMKNAEGEIEAKPFDEDSGSEESESGVDEGGKSDSESPPEKDETSSEDAEEEEEDGSLLF